MICPLMSDDVVVPCVDDCALRVKRERFVLLRPGCYICNDTPTEIVSVCSLSCIGRDGEMVRYLEDSIKEVLE